MASDTYGAAGKPVPSHPVNRIVEFHNPIAKVAILRVGDNLGPYHWPVTFRRVAPKGMTVTDANGVMYKKAEIPTGGTRLGYKPPWLGRTDGVEVPGDPQYAIDILPYPVRADVPIDFDDVESPGEGRYKFPESVGSEPVPLATPSGAGTLAFRDTYAWFAGWAGPINTPGRDNLIINLAKLRRDFSRREKDGSGKIKVTPPAFVQVECVNGLRRGELTGPSDQYFVTLDVYADGDETFTLDVRGNVSYGSGRLVASETRRVLTTTGLHTVKFTFKDRKIEFTGVT